MSLINYIRNVSKLNPHKKSILLESEVNEITTPLERRQKILDHRQWVLENTTPEQRKEQMELFIKNLDEWGKEHFPHTRGFTEEESRMHSEMLNEMSEIVKKLY